MEAQRLAQPGAKMPFDERLADRIREFVPKATEKRMFGGIGWMERGNLVVGVLGDEMIARVGPAATAEALAQEGVRPFDFTGKAMSGWVMVSQECLPEDEDIAAWVERCRKFARTLPAK